MTEATKHRSTERERLAAEVNAMLEAGVDGDQSLFDELALRIFAFQYAHNEPYRIFCEARKAAPGSIADWREIPAFPTDSFKTNLVTSFPLEEAVFANVTSGTTSASQRGTIYRDELGRDLTLLSNKIMTAAYLFPDFEEGRRCRVLLLAPSPEMAPSMGMAIGMEETRRHFGTPDSRFLLGRGGIDVSGLVSALAQSEEAGQPVALVGTTSAFVYFLKACRDRKLSFRLPEGSRIADGGGYRGRFGEMTRDDYYELVVAGLGIPPSHCVNTLGMAETATNFFDSCLRNHVNGCSDGLRHKVTPPWTRVVAMDLEDLTPLSHGQVGLLRHYDLACLPTVVGIQTDNLGFTDGRGGFEIVGRAKLVDGKVSSQPDLLTPVGPMGSKRVFRMLESYVNFSIRLKMGRVRPPSVSSSRAEVESAGEEALPSCPSVVDDLIASPDDPEAAKRAKAALEVFARSSAGVTKDDTTNGGGETD